MDKFFAAAADAYRGTGDPAAIQLAALLAAVDRPPPPAVSGNAAPAVASHLAAALMAADAHDLVAALDRRPDALDWREVGWESDMPAGFVGRYAFVELVGPDGMIRADGFRFGLYLQAPATFYPRHWHTAEELYFVLSGTAAWRQREAPARPQRPGTLIRHASDEPHTMQTLDEPLLAMWGWLGDLRVETYGIDKDGT
jgi:dimethylpropiothetin dethiomethylase